MIPTGIKIENKPAYMNVYVNPTYYNYIGIHLCDIVGKHLYPYNLLHIITDGETVELATNIGNVVDTGWSGTLIVDGIDLI
jgi:hypothetical protein